MSYPEREVRYVGKMIGCVRKMQEALDWLKRNPNSRIATETGSPFEEDGGVSFVNVLYGLGAESVEVDANDGDEVAFYVNVVLPNRSVPEDWEKQVRIIMELGRVEPEIVTVLDRRTIRLTLYDVVVADPLVCIERKTREIDNPYVQAAVERHWIPNMHELWGLLLEFRGNAAKAEGVQDECIEMPDNPEEALSLINEPYRCIEYAAERWVKENYPRKHAELFDHTGGSFFRPVKEFLA